MFRPLPLLVTAALACGCQSPDPGPALGRVPASFVELYDEAAPDGLIEIEIDRDGTVREIEADIAIDAVPEHVRRAALDHLPNATITGAEREIQTRGHVWEVKLAYEGVNWELLLDDGGRVIETEKEIRADAAPAAVLAAADAALDGPRKSVEVITRGDDVEYHVKKTRDGATFKVVLSTDGTLRRIVREARAEIEIPLAR